jgi:hypothetical protein
MLPKSPQPELSHPGAHPDCCGHEAVGMEAAAENPSGALPERLKNEAGPLLGSLKPWLLWFLAFFGIYASSSVCPFCGTPGCPVGVGGAALVGGVFACLWQYGKMVLIRLRGLVAALRQSHRA